MNLRKLTAAFAIVLTAVASEAAMPLYLDDTKPLDDRVEDALQRMTLEEKIAIIHAQSKFSSPGVPRLGIPELWTTDGPHGVRPEVMWDLWDQAKWTNDSCVAFPALTCLAATWNPDMALLYGTSIGEEARYREKDVLLGPGVCIYRTPLNGRNFEYMGEDPYLASRMVVPYIRGVQSNGVATCVKHFALNNHEKNRHTTNVIVDDRTLYEIYLPAFKAAVTEGDSWSIMGAYDLYQNQHEGHNHRLLVDILRGEWGYKGAVISDWGGTHDTSEAAANGLDLEFGTWTDGLHGGSKNAYDNYYMALPYLHQIQEGKASIDSLDQKVRNVLRLTMLTAMNRQKPYGSMRSPEHYAAARRIGGEGTVLLKNDRNVLPLQTKAGSRILVVGENAIKMMTVGGGSSSLKAQHEILPLDALRARLQDATVDYARGYVGDPTGEYNGVVTGQDLNDSRSADELIADAVAKAKGADYVIFFGGLNKSNGQDAEDFDRDGLGLPYGQDRVIEALAAVNKNLVVVNVSGNAVAMPWVKKVPAIVQTWYLGSEMGNAITDVLTGDVNPSGKLPFSFPVKLTDVAANREAATYPGIQRTDGSGLWDVEYKEGIFVGYRGLEKEGIKPLFAFGHGLSYTEFTYGKPTISKTEISSDDTVTVSVDVKNTGKRAGQETVQLYIADKKSSVERPAKELKGFKKVALEPGQSTTVTFTIGVDALQYFDADAHKWVAEPGRFEAIVAAAADDVRGRVAFNLK